MFITLKRILKSGFKSFWRSGFLSLATVGIMVITLFSISSLVILNMLIASTIDELQKKIDISVYFNPDAQEADILEIKTDLEKLSAVKTIEYISKEEAWMRFKKKYEGNSTIIQSAEEIEKNPLFATFNIKAKSLDGYPIIVNFLENERYSQFIDKINYRESEKQISKLSAISKSIQKSGFVISLIFVTLVILVTFNTIRLAMYAHNREVEIMRLVGATSWFIRLPFVIEGILFGIFGCLITMAVLYGVILVISPKVVEFLPGFNLLDFFQAHFLVIFGIQLCVGMALGIISSLIAIRKYLKV